MLGTRRQHISIRYVLFHYAVDTNSWWLWCVKEKKIEHLHRLLLAGVPSQGPRHTKDVINMVPVVSLFRTQHWKRKYWLDLSQEFRYENNVMNNIFEVGGHLPLWRGWKTPNDHAEPTQTRTLKKLQSDQSKDKRVLYCVHILNIEADKSAHTCILNVLFQV